MPEESEEESAAYISNQLLKIFRKELQNVKKEKRDKKRKKDKKIKNEEEGKRKEESPTPKEARLNFRDAVLLLIHVYTLCGPGDRIVGGREIDVGGKWGGFIFPLPFVETGYQLRGSDGEEKLKAIFGKYVEELLQLFLLDDDTNESLIHANDDATASLKQVLEPEHEPLPLRMTMREAVRERKGVDPMVEHLFSRLHAISQTRRNLKTTKRLYRPGWEDGRGRNYGSHDFHRIASFSNPFILIYHFSHNRISDESSRASPASPPTRSSIVVDRNRYCRRHRVSFLGHPERPPQIFLQLLYGISRGQAQTFRRIW